MRLGLPGLEKKIRTEAHRDPTKKGIYVFVSRDFSRVKLFFYDRNGFALLYKRVRPGTFEIKTGTGYKAITAVNLKTLLHGVRKLAIEEK
jgi:transposase